jgi:predicted AAA+ superfamily ATPase
MDVDTINVMDVDHLDARHEVNSALLRGEVEREGLLPHLDLLRTSSFIFRHQFGLDDLPREPGLILVRGPRQFGKSTWIEGALRKTIQEFGPGSGLYLNGDHLRDDRHLSDVLRDLASLYPPQAPVRRLFIDEITAVRDWSKGLKRALDQGFLRKVLVVTTGSNATDLRRGTERLPGRKGKLARMHYLFLPVSFSEFARVCGNDLGEALLPAYLLSGGSPAACAELGRQRRIPEWIIETTRDWILGECAIAGRQRHSLVAVMENLHRHGSSPLGQTKLAREAGLANNTVAAGYLEMLADLLSVGISLPWDASRRIELPRKPGKSPFVNLLVAVAWAPETLRCPGDFGALSPARQGVWLEWLVAQELYRRRALAGEAEPERLPFWQSNEHELDFVPSPNEYIEVKRGPVSPIKLAWFARAFPTARLTVICQTPFETDRMRGVTIQDFLHSTGTPGHSGP